MPERMYFAKPDYDSIGIGSLVWHYHHNLCRLQGPFYVVEIRHGGYGNGSYKKWILFDTLNNSYHTTRYENLRVPKDCLKEEE